MFLIDRATRLRLRRKARKQKRKLVGAGQDAEEGFEKLFVRRLARLDNVRRFVLAWTLLIVFAFSGLIVQTRSLGAYYLVEKPVPGGSFSEGIIGIFSNANPLFATGAVDNAVSRLLFSGLMRYDNANTLVGDLATSITSENDGRVYTVTLRDDITWHDGQPITSDDVVFTYGLIKNPDVRSPLFTSWSDVSIKALDESRVRFSLPDPLASFPHSLVNGIVPQHILQDVELSQLRSSSFNSIDAVGSGPFVVRDIAVDKSDPEDFSQTIFFNANSEYHHGQPKLERFAITTFQSEVELLSALKNNEIDAAAGVEIFSDQQTKSRLQPYNIPLTGQINVFLKSSASALKNKQVRQALVRATNRSAIRQSLQFPLVSSNSPFLQSHFSYDQSKVQLSHNQEEAMNLLDKAGWELGSDGTRYKEKQPLTLRLLTQETSENLLVSQHIQSQWRNVGVDLQVVLLDADDLQSKVSNHDYDVLLYGISIGPDPDVFAYWHGSQASPGSSAWLNFSEYNSAIADESLESGRTRIDEDLRAVKYQPFLEAWREDAPAIALYQPRFLYLASRSIAGFDQDRMNNAADRYNNVHEWMLRRRNVQKTIDDIR